jgi:hypothetical protein
MSDREQEDCPAYPVDGEGYAIPSADPRADMERYNVVVGSILSPEELERSRAALWRAMGPKVTSDPSTWETANWPAPDNPFLTTDYATCEVAFRNRVHPALVDLYATLHGTRELWSTIDFWGVKRAAYLPSGEERADWRAPPLRLHWDTDVVAYAGERRRGQNRYQALLALNDNSQTVGSFRYVPGGANGLVGWLSAYGPPESGKYVPRNNPLQFRVERLPLRAGEVVIWDVGVPHSNFPNYDFQPRLTQYVRMIPRRAWALERERQALPHYWRTNPDLRRSLRALEWAPEERSILALDMVL